MLRTSDRPWQRACASVAGIDNSFFLRSRKAICARHKRAVALETPLKDCKGQKESIAIPQMKTVKGSYTCRQELAEVENVNCLKDQALCVLSGVGGRGGERDWGQILSLFCQERILK